MDRGEAQERRREGSSKEAQTRRRESARKTMPSHYSPEMHEQARRAPYEGFRKDGIDGSAWLLSRFCGLSPIDRQQDN